MYVCVYTYVCDVYIDRQIDIVFVSLKNVINTFQFKSGKLSQHKGAKTETKLNNFMTYSSPSW